MAEVKIVITGPPQVGKKTFLDCLKGNRQNSQCSLVSMLDIKSGQDIVYNFEIGTEAACDA